MFSLQERFLLTRGQQTKPKPERILFCRVSGQVSSKTSVVGVFRNIRFPAILRFFFVFSDLGSDDQQVPVFSDQLFWNPY